jgi:hypothetical protein
MSANARRMPYPITSRRASSAWARGMRSSSGSHGSSQSSSSVSAASAADSNRLAASANACAAARSSGGGACALAVAAGSKTRRSVSKAIFIRLTSAAGACDLTSAEALCSL